MWSKRWYGGRDGTMVPSKEKIRGEAVEGKKKG